MCFCVGDCKDDGNTIQLENRRFVYNLQFFGEGGDKTEKATPKKLEDARKEGRVARSSDLINGLMLLLMFFVLRIFGNFMAKGFLESFVKYYNKTADISMEIFDVKQAVNLGNEIVFDIVIACLPVLIGSFLVAFAGNVVQIGWKVTTKPLKPKLDRLNPIGGLKRMFSQEKVVELIKSILKVLAIAIVAYNEVKDRWLFILNLYDFEFMQAIVNIFDIVLDVGVKISVLFVIIGIADFGYQKWKHLHDLRMSKQEVKDEMKQSEGDPQVKGRIRQKMREGARRRMMQELPKADVVITNPTHFAVAIKYDKEKAEAPYVLAKGADYVAATIKEAAKEHKIEIVENKPLARMLYYNVEIGEQIPPELYQMVAEVLAYVYSVKNKEILID
ncbi:flagellar biosynthetic protein FlhB [Catonella morbi ATCC 51271]|uniref:Flagellar biosynthetic protein FlhB n=1 Tax=Catonella morbi ATCC 51271 TaxID=592026 RepID=V2Y2L9_9FIRM|nr:flagellar biosynthesis protein FlhB [Catonella morbi]ESL01951.1 flagellar biosynthetic protein FlhB [Catonella morbi ATCC 51271]